MTRGAALSLLLLLAACGADFGALPGMELRTHHFVASGRLAASTKIGMPMNDEGVLLGLALESRAEANVGSRWEGGAMFGWGKGPAAIGGRSGIEIYGEIGTPLRSTLIAHGDCYLGLAFAVPLYFGAARHVADLNRSTSVLNRRLELVPLLRARLQRGHDEKDHDKHTLAADVTLGLQLRFRAFSDLL